MEIGDSVEKQASKLAKKTMTKKITVLLVDDHSLVRRGFRRMLEDEPDMSVVGEAGDGEEAVALARELQAAGRGHGLRSARSMNGLDATRQILASVTRDGGA